MEEKETTNLTLEQFAVQEILNLRKENEELKETLKLSRANASILQENVNKFELALKTLADPVDNSEVKNYIYICSRGWEGTDEERKEKKELFNFLLQFVPLKKKEESEGEK